MEKNINGRTYQLCYCKQCGTEKWKRKSLLKQSPDTFCSSQCLSEYKRTGSILICEFCSQKFYRARAASRGAAVYCSRSCSNSANNSKYKSGPNHPSWKGGERSYRDRALSCYGTLCMSSACPFREKEVPVQMLDVDHIDGDRSNNDLGNLQVLCVWCHALKTRIP